MTDVIRQIVDAQIPHRHQAEPAPERCSSTGRAGRYSKYIYVILSHDMSEGGVEPFAYAGMLSADILVGGTA